MIAKISLWLGELNAGIKPKAISSFRREISLERLQIPICTVRIKNPFLVQWICPEKRKFKLNIDGASKGNPGMARAGGIIRDSKDEVLISFSSSLGLNSNNYAESTTFLKGLQICYQLGIMLIEVVTDSMLLVQWFTQRRRLHVVWRRYGRI